MSALDPDKPLNFTPEELDATLELEQARVERVLAWERCRERVKLARATTSNRLALVYSHSNEVQKAPFVAELFSELEVLLASLSELEKLEGEGV